MPTSCRYLQSTLHLFLSLDICKVKLEFTLLRKEFGTCIDDRGWHQLLAVQMSNNLVNVTHAIDIEIVYYCCLANIVFRNKKSLKSHLSGFDGDRQRTFDGLQRAVQTQFAHHHVAVQHPRIHLTVCCQDANGHWQVEARTFLADISRCHVYRDLTRRESVAAVFYGSINTLITFLDSTVGQTYKYKANAACGIYFDCDCRCLQSLYAGTECLN